MRQVVANLDDYKQVLAPEDRQGVEEALYVHAFARLAEGSAKLRGLLPALRPRQTAPGTCHPRCISAIPRLPSDGIVYRLTLELTLQNIVQRVDEADKQGQPEGVILDEIEPVEVWRRCWQ